MVSDFEKYSKDPDSYFGFKCVVCNFRSEKSRECIQHFNSVHQDDGNSNLIPNSVARVEKFIKPENKEKETKKEKTGKEGCEKQRELTNSSLPAPLGIKTKFQKRSEGAK